MGCLKVDIRQVPGISKFDLVDVGGLSASIRLIRDRICRCLSAVIRCVNSLFVSIDTVNDHSTLSVSEVGGVLMMDIGLVCMVNLDTECYLAVDDGFLITLEDCYIKVQKQ